MAGIVKDAGLTIFWIKTPKKKIAKPIINSHNKKGNQPIPL